MIRLDRDYSSDARISAGSGLYVLNTETNLFELLIPTSDMPAGASAPEGIENPLLTVSRNGQVEGKQTLEGKEYTFNWTRDNVRRLQKFEGKQLTLLERDGMEYTGYEFKGTIAFSKNEFSDNEIMNGTLYVTVNEDLGFVDDIRGMYAMTAVIRSSLPEVNITGTNSVSMILTATENATITATSEKTTVATASMGTGDDANKLTITGVAAGNAIVKLTCSATGEATSERTILVTVVAA